MIKHLLIKDWKLLWPMIGLVTAIQIGHEWAVYRSGLFGESAGAEVLMRPLTLAWFAGIAALAAATVHQDAIPGIDQDWLIRPLRRTELLLSKLIFVALTIALPMGALNLAHTLAMHMPLALSLKAIVAKELFVFVCFVIPVMAVASATRNMTELLLVAAALVLVYALGVGASALLLGDAWCPTCNTGMAWLQHLLQHLLILAGACLILGLQYYRRTSTLSQSLALVGAGLLAFLQVTWSSAFAVERLLSGVREDATLVVLELGPQGAPPAGEIPGAVPEARRAAQHLMHGDVDQAIVDLRRQARTSDNVALDLPVRASRAADEMLLADRSQVRLFDQHGGILYSSVSANSPGLMFTSADDPAHSLGHDIVKIPAKTYEAAAVAPVRLQLDYFLTRVKRGSEYRIAADNGRLQAPDIGVCATSADRNTVTLHCKSIRPAPFCFSATLYDSEGRHNPEVFKCDPDYRRHWPPLVDILNFYGVDVPLRDRYGIAHYTVDASSLGSSYLLFRIYTELDHIERSVTAASFQPQVWRTQGP